MQLMHPATFAADDRPLPPFPLQPRTIVQNPRGPQRPITVLRGRAEDWPRFGGQQWLPIPAVETAKLPEAANRIPRGRSVKKLPRPGRNCAHSGRALPRNNYAEFRV